MKMMLNFADSVKNEHTEDDYCCDKMKSVMESGNFDLFYERQFAQTFCKRRKYNNVFWYWDYCPFCGKNIESKTAAYQKILRKEFGIEDAFDEEVEKQLPDEFKTDEWWKKRGL